MDYLWIKALHIAVVCIWIGGVLMLAVTVSAIKLFEPQHPGQPHPLLKAVRRWDRLVTTPALLLVWIAGLTLAVRGQWFPAPWLLAKLVMVIVLSALHGMLSGTLRRYLETGGYKATAVIGQAAPTTIILVMAIVGLVVLKPF